MEDSQGPSGTRLQGAKASTAHRIQHVGCSRHREQHGHSKSAQRTSRVWLDHEMAGERDEAGEVTEAKRQWGLTKGFKQDSGLVREG